MGLPDSASCPLSSPGTGSPSLSLSVSILVSLYSVLGSPPASSGSLFLSSSLDLSALLCVSSSVLWSLLASGWLLASALFFQILSPFLLCLYLLVYLFIFVSAWHNVGLELSAMRSRVTCSADINPPGAPQILSFFVPFSLSFCQSIPPHPHLSFPVSSPLSLSDSLVPPPHRLKDLGPQQATAPTADS